MFDSEMGLSADAEAAHTYVFRMAIKRLWPRYLGNDSDPPMGDVPLVDQ